MPITVEKNPSPASLAAIRVSEWPIWTKEASTFPWTYDEPETCCLFEGEVVVTPDGGEPVTLEPGDLVTFSAGLSCTWEVRRPVRKALRFG